MTRDDKLALAETLGSVFWFFMDACWMLDWATAATVLVVPTVLVNLAAFVWTERRAAHLAVTAAVNAWVGMNVLWMIGDLRAIESLLSAAKLLAALGVALLLASLAASPWRATVRQAVRRFRRLRLR